MVCVPADIGWAVPPVSSPDEPCALLNETGGLVTATPTEASDRPSRRELVPNRLTT